MDIESDPLLTLEEIVKFASGAELYFTVKYEQSDLSHFLLHTRKIRKDVSLGGPELFLLCIQLPVGYIIQ